MTLHWLNLMTEGESLHTSLERSWLRPGVGVWGGTSPPLVLSEDNLARLAAISSLSLCRTMASTANHSLIVVS